ncbi:MAG: serine/threonine-protein kinase [Solirubrobacterales bacterium]
MAREEAISRGGADQLSAGSEFGGFRVERTLGRGGMGIVYLATELRLDRQVALKVIRADLAGDESFRARFRSESRTAAAVEDPRVVTVFGAGETDGLLYVSMRYVAGRDLGRMVEADGPLPPEDAARLIAQVADGLDAVHAAGLVHRDVKPHNVIVGDEGDAYLTDFGLAKAIASTTGLTMTGEVIGTVDYMAPEQIEGRRVDARTDVYALGCVLFHAITGRVPFAERESSAKMWAHVHEAPPSAAGSGASVLDPVIRRAMAKDPVERFPSAGDLGRAAVAATRGEAVTEPEHVVGAGEAAPLPETVRLSRDPSLPPTDPLPRPRRRRRLIAILAILLLASLGAAALIEVPRLSDSGRTEIPNGVTVPSLTGQPLDVAERRLDDLGLRSSEEGGGLFGVIVPSDWVVCATAPGPNTVVRPDSTVRLSIDRPGAC